MFLHLSVILFTGGCLTNSPPPGPEADSPPPNQRHTQPQTRHRQPPPRETATPADGTPPTGMHSCCDYDCDCSSLHREKLQSFRKLACVNGLLIRTKGKERSCNFLYKSKLIRRCRVLRGIARCHEAGFVLIV